MLYMSSLSETIGLVTSSERMLCEGVLVVAKDENLSTGFCSGTRIGDWVLTHGSILIPFFDNNNKGTGVSSEHYLRNKLNDMSGSDYIKKNKILDIQSLMFTVVTAKAYSENFQNFPQTNETDKLELSHKAKFEKIFQCTSVRDALNSAVMSWETDIMDESTELSVPLVMSTLLLLKLTPCETNKRGLAECILMATKSIHVYRGMEILVESTPFSAISFFNSWSCGIVSNLLGPTNSVLLLDARLTIGCEGAPIFFSDHGKKGNLIGIVVKSMTWLRGEWIGFSVGLTLRDVIQCLAPKMMITNNFTCLNSDEDNISHYIDILDTAIVRVCCGHKWGSGVVVDAADGIILTCAHVIFEGKEIFVEVQRSGNVESVVASVLYKTPSGMPFDIAVISLGRNKNLKQLPLADKAPCKGEKVFSVGYSYFSKYGTAKVTISRGIISSVSQDGPVHTTCCVHSGQSGGALIRPPYQLLALIVSNAQVENIVFPEHNLSVSYECFLKPLKAFIDSKDISGLKSLLNTDVTVRSKWKLEYKSKL